MKYVKFFTGAILLLSMCSLLTDTQTHTKDIQTHTKDISLIDTIPDIDTSYSFVRIDNLPSNFDTVPGGNNVYRSNQPRLNQLKSILESYDIKTVIRMNAEEGTGISISSERKLVESMGLKFVWVNAHQGYEKDKGYIKSLDTLQPYLHNGKVLIHCTAGADRTGYQVAKYIKDKFDWSEEKLWKYTIKYNNWVNYICQGRRGYIKYMEAFYKLSDWCEKFGKNCNICK